MGKGAVIIILIIALVITLTIFTFAIIEIQKSADKNTAQSFTEISKYTSPVQEQVTTYTYPTNYYSTNLPEGRTSPEGHCSG